MNVRSVLLPVFLLVVFGCQDAEQQQRAAVKKNLDQIEKDIERYHEEHGKSGANEHESTYLIATDTVYYKVGPQQARPPDGTFKAGTKVAVVEDAGSYSLVRSADGVVAYVAADALKEIGSGGAADE